MSAQAKAAALTAAIVDALRAEGHTVEMSKGWNGKPQQPWEVDGIAAFEVSPETGWYSTRETGRIAVESHRDLFGRKSTRLDPDPKAFAAKVHEAAIIAVRQRAESAAADAARRAKIYAAEVRADEINAGVPESAPVRAVVNNYGEIKLDVCNLSEADIARIVALFRVQS